MTNLFIWIILNKPVFHPEIFTFIRAKSSSSPSFNFKKTNTTFFTHFRRSINSSRANIGDIVFINSSFMFNSKVGSDINKLEIFNSVIKFVSIKMIYLLDSFKRSFQKLGHNISMLVLSFSINSNQSIAMTRDRTSFLFFSPSGHIENDGTKEYSSQ